MPLSPLEDSMMISESEDAKDEAKEFIYHSPIGDISDTIAQNTTVKSPKQDQSKE